MQRLEGVLKAIATVEKSTQKSQVVAALKHAFSLWGTTHYLITGLPLPGQDIASLIIVQDWRIAATKRQFRPSATDLVFNKAVDWRNFIVLKESLWEQSPLITAAGLSHDKHDVLLIPIDPLYHYQGLCVLTFDKDPELNGELQMNNMSYADRTALKCLISAAFIKFRSFGLIGKRDGELTSREREVISLCALGYTAAQIATRINVKERTVVAHISNACNKLDAKNRSECVVQALRYNQIGVGTKTHRGFYEIETEIMSKAEYDTKEYF